MVYFSPFVVVLTCLEFRMTWSQEILKADARNEEHTEQSTCTTTVDYLDKNLNLSAIACEKNKICEKHFALSIIDMLPYTYNKEVEELLKICCGPCVRFAEGNIFKSTKEVTALSIQSSDFVYPILASEATKRLYGYHYAPFMSVRKAMYITRKDDGTILVPFLRLLPFISICILLAIIAGFIAWAIESRHNEEFPTTFVSGIFEGFWWSFATATTVGYGDRNMKSVPGRIFGIIWILFGIVGFGVLTGELTTHIIRMDTPQVHDMTYAKVGILKNRRYDTFIASQHGGHVVFNKNVTDFHSDALHLIEKLKAKQLDGIMFDLYTLKFLTFFMRRTNGTLSTRWKAVRNFFLEHTVRSEKGYEGKTLTYGMLIKHSKDYNYFKDSIAESRLRIELTWDSQWNAFGFPSDTEHYYSHVYFNKVVYAIICALGMIAIFGIIYEVRRRITREKYKRESVSMLATES